MSTHPSPPIQHQNGDPATIKRPSRACTARRYKLNHKSPSSSPSPPSSPRKKQYTIVTPLVAEPSPSQLPRRLIQSMWQLASVLNFFNVFRPILKINVEFTAEELETALITPNNTLADIHMPLLKVIPPNARAALGHNTWITVLCRKLRDWWYWVAEGELPIVASRGTEVEAYNALDPGVRVLILKALCDIRAEQEDIRNYIDNTIKAGVQLSAFRKERVGGDSFGVSYWYEDDPIIGYRLYRETRKVEIEKVVGKNGPPLPASSHHWETVATNFYEFQDVAEKLFSSKNRTEVSLGKKLKAVMLPEIENTHKKKEELVLAQRKNKEKLLKKQHREALLLNSTINTDGLVHGRSRRDRKHVTYTFDDFDRSINQAIKTIKQNQLSPESTIGNELSTKPGASVTIRWTRSVQAPPQASLDTSSPKSLDYDDISMDRNPELLGCSDRQKQMPQLYSAKEFVEAASDCGDNAVEEVIHDDEYSREKKQKRKLLSSFEEDGTIDSSCMNEDGDEQRISKNLREDTMDNKSRSIPELQCRRHGDKPTRIRISFKQHKTSEQETESTKSEMSNSFREQKGNDNA